MIRQWLLATSLFAALPVLAQTGNCPGGPPDWIVANTTHCKLWNGCPQRTKRATWTAACVGNFAERRGVTYWVPGVAGPETVTKGRCAPAGWTVVVSSRSETAIATKVTGATTGATGVASIPANGGRYEGEWRDDERNGNGIISLAMAIGTMEHRETANQWAGTAVTEGGTYAGTWTSGCFRQGGRRIAFGATPARCGFDDRSSVRSESRPGTPEANDAPRVILLLGCVASAQAQGIS